MRVLVIGELPLVEDVASLCIEAGCDTSVYLVEDLLGSLEVGEDLNALSNIQVAVELFNESSAGKQSLLAALGDLIPRETLLLSSAMVNSGTEIASWVINPERVVGFGILSPLTDEKLIELARTMQASEVYWSKAKEFWRLIGCEVVEVADGPGLVRARVVCCLINEAASALLDGISSVNDIDLAMKLGTNYPLGPFEWADHLGLDFVLGVVEGLFNEWGEDRYRPSPLLRRMVAAGYLGKKTGRGFYEYGVDVT